MSAEKKKQMGVMGLVIALVVVLVGSIVFVGAAAGWFDDPKVVLSEEYYGDFAMTDLTVSEYEELMAAKKSFVVFVDQDGCTTADRLREYITDLAREKGTKIYRMIFSEVKESSLHEFVKYYPSVVIVSRGAVRAYLRADSDEDAGAYNDFGDFRSWISRYL